MQVRVPVCQSPGNPVPVPRRFFSRAVLPPVPPLFQARLSDRRHQNRNRLPRPQPRAHGICFSSWPPFTGSSSTGSSSPLFSRPEGGTPAVMWRLAPRVSVDGGSPMRPGRHCGMGRCCNTTVATQLLHATVVWRECCRGAAVFLSVLCGSSRSGPAGSHCPAVRRHTASTECCVVARLVQNF